MKQDMTKAVQFSKTFRYIDDLLSVNDENFGNYISDIYPSDLELKDTTLTSNEMCYLDTRIKNGDSNTPFHLSVYNKRDDFSFRIVNFPHMDSNIPANPAYVVYISQLVRYVRICTSTGWILYIDFTDFHHVSLTKGSNLRYFVNCLLNSSNATVLLLRSMALHYGKLD